MNVVQGFRFAALAAAALLLLSACESCGDRCLGADRFNPNPGVTLNSDLQREFNNPLYCDDVAQCQLMFQRGAEFLRQNASMGINLQTDTILETHIPNGSPILSYRITREARDDGRFQIMTGVSCTWTGPCSQNLQEMAARVKYFMRTGTLYGTQGATPSSQAAVALPQQETAPANQDRPAPSPVITPSFPPPVLENAQADFYYKRLRSAREADETLTDEQVFGPFPASRQLDCQLNDTAVSLLLFQRTPAAFAERNRQMEAIPDTRILHEDLNVALLEGNCVNGMPEGRFVADGHFVISVLMPAGNTRTTVQLQVEGTMHNGELQGEVLVRRREVSVPGVLAAQDTRRYYSLGIYQGSAPVASHLQLDYQDDGVHARHIQHLNDIYTRTSMYTNSNLLSSFHTAYDMLDGWFTHHSSGQRLCMQKNMPSRDRYCRNRESALVAMSPAKIDFESYAVE